MNRPEFKAWLGAHAATFASVRGAFERVPADMRATLEDQWYKVLEHTEFGHAEESSARMLADAKVRPRFADDHPAAVRDLARIIAREWRAANPGEGCTMCANLRRVLIWLDFAPYREYYTDTEGYDRVVPKTSYVPCPTCRAGQARWGQRDNQMLRRAMPDGPTAGWIRERIVDGSTDLERQWVAVKAGEDHADAIRPGWRERFRARATRLRGGLPGRTAARAGRSG